MPKHYVRKYFIMGSQDCPEDPVKILTEAIDGGITAFQFREKGPDALTGQAKLALGKKLRVLCQQHGIPFFINDDIDLIEPLQVDGIHVGQDDTSVLTLRKKYPHIQIGLSISNEHELERSPLEAVNYVGVGPIFPTKTKVDAKQAIGLDWITHVRALQPNVPIVGIGGINTGNAANVIQAGADGVAVISVITTTTNIKEAVSLL